VNGEQSGRCILFPAESVGQLHGNRVPVNIRLTFLCASVAPFCAGDLPAASLLAMALRMTNPAKPDNAKRLGVIVVVPVQLAFPTALLAELRLLNSPVIDCILERFPASKLIRVRWRLGSICSPASVSFSFFFQKPLSTGYSIVSPVFLLLFFWLVTHTTSISIYFRYVKSRPHLGLTYQYFSAKCTTAQPTKMAHPQTTIPPSQRTMSQRFSSPSLCMFVLRILGDPRHFN